MLTIHLTFKHKKMNLNSHTAEIGVTTDRELYAGCSNMDDDFSAQFGKLLSDNLSELVSKSLADYLLRSGLKPEITCRKILDFPGKVQYYLQAEFYEEAK